GPEAVLLDEPLTGLDPAAMRRMKTRILETARSGVAVILSSHLLHLVEELCERVVVLIRGKKVLDRGDQAGLAGAGGGRRPGDDLHEGDRGEPGVIGVLAPALDDAAGARGAIAPVASPAEVSGGIRGGGGVDGDVVLAAAAPCGLRP